MQKWTDDRGKRIRFFFAGTADPVRPTQEGRQLQFQPAILDMYPAKKSKYKIDEIDTPFGKFIQAQRLLETTSSTTESPALAVLKDMVDTLATLQLLEAIYGYTDSKTCRVVAIADVLSSIQRDIIWKINIEFQRRYPEIDVVIRILQRRGRDLSDVFENDGTAVIVRENALV